MSEETERVGSGPKRNGAGIDPTAIALAMAGTSRERVDAFLKDQQELVWRGWVQFMDDGDAGASSASVVSRTTLVPNYRDLGPTFKSHQVVERLNFKGGSYV